MWTGSSTGSVTVATGNKPPHATAATSSRLAPRSEKLAFMHSPSAYISKREPNPSHPATSMGIVLRLAALPQTLSMHALHAPKEWLRRPALALVSCVLDLLTRADQHAAGSTEGEQSRAGDDRRDHSPSRRKN